MKKFIEFSLLLFLCLYSSCRVSEQIGKATDRVMSPMIATSMAVSQILAETTSFIYKNDSLELDTSIYIHQLKISFVGKTDSFELKLDSIKATWSQDSIMQFKKVTVVRDSIYYSQADIPYQSFYLEKDSFALNVTCKYLHNMNIKTGIVNFKCLEANYIMRNQVVVQKNIFKNCYNVPQNIDK